MRPLRRLIIVVTELALLPFVIVCVAAGAWLGTWVAPSLAEKIHVTGAPRAIIEAAPFAGAFAGFMVSMIAAAAIVALAQIERNTFDVARYYRERRKIEAAIDRATGQK
jgi:hypothetical protein